MMPIISSTHSKTTLIKRVRVIEAKEMEQGKVQSPFLLRPPRGKTSAVKRKQAQPKKAKKTKKSSRCQVYLLQVLHLFLWYFTLSITSGPSRWR